MSESTAYERPIKHVEFVDEDSDEGQPEPTEWPACSHASCEQESTHGYLDTQTGTQGWFCEQHRGYVACTACDASGVTTNHTWTHGPEEVDCPACDGEGYVSAETAARWLADEERYAAWEENGR